MSERVQGDSFLKRLIRVAYEQLKHPSNFDPVVIPQSSLEFEPQLDAKSIKGTDKLFAIVSVLSTLSDDDERRSQIVEAVAAGDIDTAYWHVIRITKAE